MRHVLQQIPLIGSLLYRPLLGLMNLRMMLEDAVTPAVISDVNASIYITLAHWA
jgi:hypothetical protein